MPVTADDFLWEATGFSASGTSVVVTHPDAGGTTAGTTVLIFLYTAATTVTMPAGFTNVGAAVLAFAYVKSDVAAAETSWTFTLNTSTTAGWYMVELDNVSLAAPSDGNATSTSTLANGATGTTGTAAMNAGSSGVAFAFFGANKVAGGDVQSWSGYTNSFVERVDTGPAGVAGRQVAVAYKFFEGWSTYETTATFATSAASASTSRLILLLRSADASINAPLAYLTGFEFGTHGGFVGAVTGSPLGSAAAAGTFGTNYLVQAGSARNGGYGLRVAASASVAYVQLPIVPANTFAFGGNVRAVSGSGTPNALFFNTSQSDLGLLYDVTNEKFGLQWNVVSPVWQTGTTPLGTWAWVDIRATLNSSAHHADWSIGTGTGDGSQTSPADVTGAPVASASTSVYLGHLSASQTATFDYDDVVTSRHSAAYPLGPHVVRLLTPETTGATVSGTSTNFSRFTANGSLAAIDADTAGALLDEVPPTVSASSDGVVQTAVAASDYLNLPMTTYALAPNEIIAGVRFVASLWGGTGTGTGTLGWRGHDGLTETTFVAAGTLYDADSLTTVSATYPTWASSMWSGASNGAWTQTRLDDCAIRMGFSTDATPDMGASAVYLEVATREISNSWVVHRLTDDEDPDVNAAVVAETLHPYNSTVRTFSVSNDDPLRTAEFRFYETGGAEHADSPVVVAPTDPPVDVVVGAEAFGEIESTSFSWQ